MNVIHELAKTKTVLLISLPPCERRTVRSDLFPEKTVPSGERGTHAELMEQNGHTVICTTARWYWKLWKGGECMMNEKKIQ